jgi:hypothetical protein
MSAALTHDQVDATSTIVRLDALFRPLAACSNLDLASTA